MKSAFSRQHFVSFAGRLIPIGLLFVVHAAIADFVFVHPGLLQGREDLERIKNAVAAREESILSGYLVFSNHLASRASYKMRGPFAEIGRRPNVHFNEFDQDANAAYQCALMWCITGNRAYAGKSKQILNGWSSTLKRCTGADAILMAGLGPFKLINAAELIRHTDAGWSDSDIQQCERMFKDVIYPVTKNFAPFANGNWDAAAMKMNLAIGVFCNDGAIFDAALRYYTNGAGNGSIEHYIINDTGQCQESGRDQAHTQLGLGCLAECCEIAWHQGLNLYGYDDNRLLKGFEYTAAYNLGEKVPFVEMTDRTGKYHQKVISSQQRGRFRPIYEMVFNHYVNRAGVSAPKTRQVIERNRPEGAAPGADHPGFGTLLYTRPHAGRSTESGTAGPITSATAIAADAFGTDANAIRSPEGNVVIQFTLASGGAPRYSVEYLGKPVVLESGLGFEPDFTNSFVVTGVSSNSHDGEWTQVYGERKIVPDNYRELNVDLKHSSGRLMRITFRAYNEGAALRYSFPEQARAEFRFTGELTEFRFPEGTFGYEEHGTEGDYHRVNTADIQPYCERPLTLEFASGIFASVAEAANQRYPRMMLSPLPGVPGALVSALGGDTSNTAARNQRNDPTTTLKPGDSAPWRMFVVGERPGDLLERNYLMLNLNPPCALEDTSWIKPGKVMRDTTLTTTNSKAIIDFAATAGLQYVLLDAKWYGSEDSATGDATTVRVPNLDITEIVRYGGEKNVGLILYVDRRQMKKQRDTLFPLYEKWGVKGVKIGFVDVGPQSETAWITETIQKAAEHHLVLNIHDGYRSTGLSRTWPNLLTVEGVQGNEHFPTPEHNCMLPFTRYIAGPADYTVCYFDNRIKTTHAHQLALAVISYSPLQSIFWYDRPGMYHGEPEVEFFRKVATVWDETKVIAGKIGEYVSIARHNGDDWFVGTINNSQSRTIRLPLAFLIGGRKYLAHVYSDDDSVKTRTHVAIETRPVNSESAVMATLHAGGGQAIWIEAVSANNDP